MIGVCAITGGLEPNLPAEVSILLRVLAKYIVCYQQNKSLS
jgi:hypothetical protein